MITFEDINSPEKVAARRAKIEADQELHGRATPLARPYGGRGYFRKGKCVHCGLKKRADGCDPCLGKLPGVAAACCGHGHWRGYILFLCGTRIGGDFNVSLDRDPAKAKEVFDLYNH